MLGNRVRRHLLHCIFIGVGSAAVRFDRRYGLAAMFLGYTMAGGRLMEGMMARKSRLTRVAVGIGSAIGRADRKAHQVAKAGLVAKKELENISKQVDGLKRQLQKTAKRLKHALQ
jgi:hypothetical protein